MATQAERRTTTRAAIVAAAQTCFVESGYAATSLADIERIASVSRGALYHHFSGKEDVMAAVFLATSSEAIRRAARSPEPDITPFKALTAACLRWLDVVAEPAIGTILFVEGPSAIGWERARSLEEATSLGVMRAAIRAAIGSGELDIADVDLGARVIHAMLGEVALNIRHDSTSRRRRGRVFVAAMLNGLRSTAFGQGDTVKVTQSK